MGKKQLVMEWTPCEEGLPEVGTKCFVTLENGTIAKMKYNVWGWNAYSENQVIAWMRAPEPYKKEAEHECI